MIECAEDNGIVNKALSERIDASACGNHDMDTSDKFSKIIKDSKFHWLAANLCFTKITPVSKDVKKSVVITKNGERIGIIGLAPFNFAKFSFFKKGEDYIKVKGLSDSLKLVRKK